MERSTEIFINLFSFVKGTDLRRALPISWVRGCAIGKDIDSPDIGIRNGTDLHKVGIRNGTNFRDFSKHFFEKLV